MNNDDERDFEEERAQERAMRDEQEQESDLCSHSIGGKAYPLERCTFLKNHGGPCSFNYERSDAPDVDASGHCYSDADPGL